LAYTHGKKLSEVLIPSLFIEQNKKMVACFQLQAVVN